MKTLSVIIPNYNNSKYLPTCLDSVLSQTYLIDEIVIYDDCSTDNSRELLKEYAAKDSRIRLIFPEENRGVSTARDTAIRSCKSDYVVTLDADDFYYDNDKLAREMAKINESEVPACAFSQTVFVNEAGELNGDMTIRDLQKDFRFRTVTQLIGIYVARDLCIPREAYLQLGGFVKDMSLYEDWNLLLKLMSICPVYFSEGYGTAYRQKATGLSHVSNKKLLKGKIRAFKDAGKVLKYTPKEVFVFYLRTYYCGVMDVVRTLLGR